MMHRRRIVPILTLTLALVTLATSPRALFARPAQVPRWQSAKRPHLPRHVLPQAAFDAGRPDLATRRTRAEVDRLSAEARLETSTVLLGSPLPGPAAVELAKPRYLRLLEDPHRPTSPPA
ncbi:MAG TPA: hypothetical protein VKW04_02255 [Planctomycetota bacterium]|nr:hypothetical protein [Planctomycetota bacterium]